MRAALSLSARECFLKWGAAEFTDPKQLKAFCSRDKQTGQLI
jgi:hypothetical protein